jgi:hypothetical protein
MSAKSFGVLIGDAMPALASHDWSAAMVNPYWVSPDLHIISSLHVMNYSYPHHPPWCCIHTSQRSVSHWNLFIARWVYATQRSIRENMTVGSFQMLSWRFVRRWISPSGISIRSSGLGTPTQLSVLHFFQCGWHCNDDLLFGHTTCESLLQVADTLL